MPQEDVEYREMINAVDARTDALEKALDRETREAEINDKLAPFAPDGPWAYAPDSEKRAVRARVEKEQDQRASEALFALETIVREHGDVLEGVKEHHRQPPSAWTAWQRRHPDSKDVITHKLQVSLLDELRRQRLQHDLGSARPRAVWAAYRAAIDESANDADAIVRYVEHRHRDGWSWPSDGTEQDAHAAQQLLKAIEEQREKRIPAQVRDMEDALTRARKIVTQARDVHKVQPRRVEDITARRRAR